MSLSQPAVKEGLGEFSRVLLPTSPTTTRADASKWIQSLKPEIFIFRRDIQKEGDKAKIITPVQVSFEGGMKVDLQNVNINFRRHTGSRYWLFPYADWQIESVTSDGFDPSSIVPMGLP